MSFNAVFWGQRATLFFRSFPYLLFSFAAMLAIERVYETPWPLINSSWEARCWFPR